jgi:hypothetical protein
MQAGASVHLAADRGEARAPDYMQRTKFGCIDLRAPIA